MSTRTVLKFDEYVLAVAEGWHYMLQIVERSKNVGTDVLIAFSTFENDRDTFTELLDDAVRVSSVSQRQKIIRGFQKSTDTDQDDDAEDSPLDYLTDWFDKIFMLATDLQLGDIINNQTFEEQETNNEDVNRVFELMRGIQQTILGVALVNQKSDQTMARLMSYSSEIVARLAVIYFKSKGVNVNYVDSNALHTLSGTICVTPAIISTTPELNADIATALLCTQLRQANIPCSVEFYADTFGVFSSHVPSNRPFESARLVRELSYDEALEIAATNSHAALQPNAIRILQEGKINAVIRSSKLYDIDTSCQQGTFITHTNDMSSRITCICLRTGIMLISIDSLEMWKRIGFLSDLFALFKRYQLSIDLVTTSEANVTVTLDADSNELEHSRLQQLLQEIRDMNCRVTLRGPCTGISFIGRKVAQQLGHVLQFLNESQSPPTVHLISQAASDVNLTLIVDQNDAEKISGVLHDRLLETQGDHFGPKFEDLMKQLR